MFTKTKLLILSVLFASTNFAQTFQATIKMGSSGNSVRAVIKPNATLNSAQISSVQLTFLVPVTVGAAPIATISNNTFITGINYVQFNATEVTADGAYYVYTMDGVGSASVPTQTYTINTEYDLLEVSFNGTLNTSQVRLAQLINGGTVGANAGNYNYYLAFNGTDRVNEVAQFYGTNSFNSGLGYSGYGYASINNIALPVKWLDFSVARQQNNALIQWKVIGEENTVLYELERSLNGRDFERISTIKKMNGTEVHTYNYSDVDINKLQTSILYYRVKQVDREGQFTYSEVRTLKLNSKGDVSIYPNPVKEGFYVQFAHGNTVQEKVQLQLVTINGQLLETRTISAIEATNYYFSIANNGSIKSGTYLLKIYSGENLLDSKSIIVQR